MLLKQILIFLKLKYNETIGILLKEYCVPTLIFLFFWIISMFLFMFTLAPFLLCCFLSIIIGFLSLVLYWTWIDLKNERNKFMYWIKANWKQAGEIVRKENKK